MTTALGHSGGGATFEAATDEHAVVAKDFVTEGKVSGHGLGAWLPADQQLAADLVGPQALQGNNIQPVVAILDTGIRPHAWLPTEGDKVWFVDDQWPSTQVALPEWCPHRRNKVACYGSHAGHATFLAGLIRQAAPDAGLLSYQVMDIHGRAKDDRIILALERLAMPAFQSDLLRDQQRRVVAVLLAFGRVGDPNEPDIKSLREAVANVASTGIHIVCAAGNDGTDQLHYPAAFAAEPELSPQVTAVGGLTANHLERAPFSNYGPWVGAWREAVNRYSSMPWRTTALGSGDVLPDDARNPDAGTPILEPDDDGLARGDTPDQAYAWWSGTSFAAAQYVGELAARYVGESASGADPGRPSLLPPAAQPKDDLT